MNNYNRIAAFKYARPFVLFLLPALLIISAAFWFSMGAQAQAQAEDRTQTLVFLRHAEKPAMGLGQLNCQGLNRAIALSTLLPREFGNANFIFAADPSRHVEEGDNDESYGYLRPLLTVGPAAIKLGLPININFGANDTQELADELLLDKYHGATVYTAWSNGYLPELINQVAEEATGQKQTIADDWDKEDFDSIYVLTVLWHDGKATLHYKKTRQGLDGGSSTCPS